MRRVIGAMFLLALVVGCPRRPPDTVPDVPVDGHLALYRARVEVAGERSRRFRLLIYVAEPDRMRAEILTPIGTTALIADGGNGRIAVSVVRSKTAYVGASNPQVLRQLVGLPLEMSQLVGSLLGVTDPPPGVNVEREGPAAPSLPETIAIEYGASRLSLELKRRRLPGPGLAVRTAAEPPERFERRPIAELGDWLVEEIPEE